MAEEPEGRPTTLDDIETGLASKKERDVWQHLARITEAYRERGSRVERLHRFLGLAVELIEACATPADENETLALLSSALDRVRECIECDGASLLAVDEENQELVFFAVHSDGPEEDLAWRRMPLSRGVAGWVATNARPVIVNSARTDERYFENFDREFRYTTRSLVAAPVIVRGQVAAVIEVLNKRGGKLFNNQDRAQVMVMAALFADHLRRLIPEENPATTFVKFAAR